ncbi:MAG: hypothetical protein REH83_06925, partial [Rickettsiella sp.]|nr:hypothetical protein [Rickettsiella sp.]
HSVIADFGCAYFADEAAAQYGSIFFTDPNLFLHSEEFSKKPLKNATKSDIWSLGLMFEVLLNGKLPAKIFNSDNHIINDNLPDTLESYINLKDWAKLYDQSNRCKKVREARDYLIMLKRKVKVPIDITNQKKILESFVLVMQLPIEERPTSKELKEYLLKFAHCFGTIEEREEKSKLFASQLMLNMEKLEINSSKTLTTSEDSNEEDEHMLSFRLCR